MPRREMEVWQEIAKNAERGAERLVAEYGDRLYAAATLLCRKNGDAEELVFRTLAQAAGKIRQYKPSEEIATTLGVPPAVASGDVKPALMATTAPTNETVKVSYLMLLGYLRECFSLFKSVRLGRSESL